MNFLVVEDNPIDAGLIKRYIDRYSTTTNAKIQISEASNAEEAITILDDGEHIDLVLLDIQLPDLDGIGMVSTMPQSAPIVIITSTTERAVDAFKIDARDYLVKPVSYDRFKQSINRAVNDSSEEEATSPNEQKENIFVNTGQSYTKINLDNISYIEALDNYIRVNRIDKKSVIVRQTMKAANSILSSDFLRVHRSYIVNIKRVEKIFSGSLMIDEEHIPVSRSKMDMLMEKIKTLN